MNRLILHVLHVMHPNICGGDISFILELGPNVPEIVADGIEIQVVVDVEDTGIGISDPSRMFEAFFTTKAKGMGIGLAICQSIIAAYGGALFAANRDEDGARFSFSHPR